MENVKGRRYYFILWEYDFIDKNRKNTKNGGDKDNNSNRDSGNLDEIERGILVFYKTK